MTKLTIGCVALAAMIAALIATPGLAADMAMKAPPPAPAPAPSWAGLYAGLTVGWGWEDPTVTATGNDILSTALLTGTFGGVGEQPVGPVSFRNKGAFGGIEAGWNWQAGRYVAGVEADFSWSDIKGQGATTSFLQNGGSPPVPTFLQQLSASQNILWFGTVRPRLGWLATDNLLLFATGGFAYGRIYDTVNYGINPAVGVARAGFTVICPGGFANCIYGQSFRIGTGWTAGAGAEYRVPGTHASLKIEYLFVDLGSSNATAVGLNTSAGTNQTSFSAAFSRTEFSAVRVGLNWKF